jgi:CSLREA domain-containing protein
MLVLALVGGAVGATLTVNTTLDVVAADGQCSLREAITAANNDSAVFAGAGECPAGEGADTISLPAGTFESTNPERPKTPTPAAGGTTIDANQIDRVLEVRPNMVVTIQRVTIIGGRAPNGTNQTTSTPRATVNGGFGTSGGSGGGILNAGTLTILDSTIANNTRLILTRG